MRSFFVLCWALCALSAPAVTVEWGPSPEAEIPGKIARYKLYYAPQDFSAPSTDDLPPVVPIILDVGLQTSAVITNLIAGQTYYFAAVSIDVDGVESDFSNVATFVAPNSDSGGQTNEVNLTAMLPRLWLYSTNGQAMLALSGPLGATFAIQSSTNPAIADSWITITNIKLTAVAPNANTNPITTLEKAFIPALETFQDPSPMDGVFRTYRIYMPLGFAIVANQILARQEIPSRLIAVRGPGMDVHIVCYVPDEAAYLDYNDKTCVVKLEPSGPTIREIATSVAASLGQDWTSASEFTVTDDGVKLLFATVVQADDPSTDPPLGVPRASSFEIITDF